MKKTLIKRTKTLRNDPINNLTNMANKRLPGLQKCSKIGFTYPNVVQKLKCTEQHYMK